MRLTRKKAIELTAKQWDRLAKTGSKNKAKAMKWEGIISEVEATDCNYCWLCLYNNRKQNKSNDNCDCSECPYCEKHTLCMCSSYVDWLNAPTKEDRKKYAKIFLEQIKELQ